MKPKQIQKPYKSFDEQIKILSDDGLNISNKIRLKNYLKEFNFQRIIDGYNDPFLVAPDKRGDRNIPQIYRENANSDMILDFFELELKISNSLIQKILTIETRLNTAICHEVLFLAKDISPSMLQIEYDKLANIFNVEPSSIWNKVIKVCYRDIIKDGSLSKIKKSLEDKNNLDISSDKNKGLKILNNNIKSFLETISFNHGLRSHSLIKSDYKDYTILGNFVEFPFYALTLFWDFGTTLEVFQILKPNIQEKIMKEYFGLESKEIFSIDDQIFGFILMMKLIKEIRNIISHNHVLYKVDYFAKIKNDDWWTKKSTRDKINLIKILRSFLGFGNDTSDNTKNLQDINVEIYNDEQKSKPDNTKIRLMHVVVFINKLNLSYDEQLIFKKNDGLNTYNLDLKAEIENTFFNFYKIVLNSDIIRYINEQIGNKVN